MIDLFEPCELFHSPEGIAYVKLTTEGARETIPVRSERLRQLMRLRCYHQKREATLLRSTLDGAIDVLAANASREARPVHVRVATEQDRVYVDLGDPRWRSVEIDTAGYRIVDSSPVCFVRPSGFLPLPEPTPGGSLGEFVELVNVDPDDADLLVMFILGAYMPEGPYPVLDISGDAGSGKSELSWMVRQLIDPNAAPLRANPDQPRDLMIAANNAWLVALDNLSSMPKALADALCRVSSGGGVSHRRNYTDDEEVLISICRPILINGIDDLDDRYDLRDRMLSVRCLPIPPSQRRRQTDLRAKFAEMRPRLLGAIFDATAAALANSAAVVASRPELPRLADLAVHCEAARGALGWEPGKALGLLRDHGIAARQRILAATPLAQAVLTFTGITCAFSPWSGTATELAAELRDHGYEAPGAAQLSTQLNRLAPTLRDAGVSVSRDRRGRSGRRTITLTLTPATRADTDDVSTVRASAQVIALADSADGTSAGSSSAKKKGKRKKKEEEVTAEAPSALSA